MLGVIAGIGLLSPVLIAVGGVSLIGCWMSGREVSRIALEQKDAEERFGDLKNFDAAYLGRLVKSLAAFAGSLEAIQDLVGTFEARIEEVCDLGATTRSAGYGEIQQDLIDACKFIDGSGLDFRCDVLEEMHPELAEELAAMEKQLEIELD